MLPPFGSTAGGGHGNPIHASLLLYLKGQHTPVSMCSHGWNSWSGQVTGPGLVGLCTWREVKEGQVDAFNLLLRRRQKPCPVC